MNIMETERLILRTWRELDIEPMTSINQDKLVMEYFPERLNKAATKQLIERFNAYYSKDGYTFYAAQLKQTGELIGFIGIAVVNFQAHFTPATEIGWRLASKHWNQGYATEAAKAVLHYAFTELKLGEIVSFTAVANAKSRRIMEKIGMQHKNASDFDHPKLTVNSPLCKHVLYRLTREKYNDRFRCVIHSNSLKPCL